MGRVEWRVVSNGRKPGPGSGRVQQNQDEKEKREVAMSRRSTCFFDFAFFASGLSGVGRVGRVGRKAGWLVPEVVTPLHSSPILFVEGARRFFLHRGEPN